MAAKFIALTMLLAVAQANVPYDTPFSNAHIGFNALKEPGLAFYGHAPVTFAAPAVIGYAPTVGHGGYSTHVGYTGHGAYGGYGHGIGLL